MNLKNFVTSHHKSTKRDYISRMIDDKINCMKVSKKYGKDYWDGDRKYGYGGYKYIPGLWTNVAKKIIQDYNLTNSSKLIDLGCGKAFLLHEIKQLLPKICLTGIDISSYGIKGATTETKPYLKKLDAREILPFQNEQFDLLISIGMLHNFRLPELKLAIKEINRISKNSYVMVESYRNEKELFNLQCWALTAQSFLDEEEWKWLYKEYNYKGDFEFIYFE
ncbi:class I SAM-dependent methyltransferase [Pseudomonadota bacterium]|nr:class I SAM-dependent methyltransferase [Pseudomonadota bacterium]